MTRWETELEREGWTVVPGILTSSEVNTCLDLTWHWLESLGSGIERSGRVQQVKSKDEEVSQTSHFNVVFESRAYFKLLL